MTTTKASGMVPVTGSLLEELLIKLQVLVAELANFYPDSIGRNRVYLDAVNATVALTINSPAISNVVQVGGVAANPAIPAAMQTAANVLRPSIVVS